MCLAIPARICELPAASHTLAMADVLGVRRRVSLELLEEDPPAIGDWVLIHVGFAMSRISDDEARAQLALLEQMGEADQPAPEPPAADDRAGP